MEHVNNFFSSSIIILKIPELSLCFYILQLMYYLVYLL